MKSLFTTSCEGAPFRAVAITVFFITVAQISQARTFTSLDGKTIEAETVKVTATTVVLALAGTNNVTINLDRLSAADQTYLKEWAEADKKSRVPKVEVRINSNKRDKRQANAYEDRQGEVAFEISIENDERDFDIESATATLVVLGKYLYNPGEGVVMERKEFTGINIPDGKSTLLKGANVKFEYDKDGFKHGEKYDGYLFIIRTAQGKVIHVSGSTARLENEADAILKLKQDEHFDENSFKSVNGGNSIRR